VPPLRDRIEDVPALAEHFLREIAAEQGIKPKTLHPGALDALMWYRWPGNVRELRNTIERLLIMAPGPVIAPADMAPPFTGRGSALPDGAAVSPAPDRAISLRDARSAFERAFIAQALRAHDGNVSKTAEALGLERSHLHRKIKLLGIELRPEDAPAP
jgi:two-component system nitrogen regulation response regulator NtrX